VTMAASPTFAPEAGHRRRLVLLLGLAGLGLSIAALQSSFDAGDRRRALAALHTTPAPGPAGISLAEALRRLNGGAPARCVAEVVSAARGLTRVSCEVTGGPPFAFRWDDLRRDGLRADDEATRRRLER
jgi:hypothetical protein